MGRASQTQHEGKFKDSGEHVLMVGPDGKQHWYRRVEGIPASEGGSQGDPRSASTDFGNLVTQLHLQRQQQIEEALNDAISEVQHLLRLQAHLQDERGNRITAQEASRRYLSRPEDESFVRRKDLPYQQQLGVRKTISLVIEGWIKSKFGKYLGFNDTDLVAPEGTRISGGDLLIPVEKLVEEDPDEVIDEVAQGHKGAEEDNTSEPEPGAEPESQEETQEVEEKKERPDFHPSVYSEYDMPRNLNDQQRVEFQEERTRCWLQAHDMIDSEDKINAILVDFDNDADTMAQRALAATGRPFTDSDVARLSTNYALASEEAMDRGVYQMHLARYLHSCHNSPQVDAWEGEVPPEVSRSLMKEATASVIATRELERRYPGQSTSKEHREEFFGVKSSLYNMMTTQQEQEGFMDATNAARA